MLYNLGFTQANVYFKTQNEHTITRFVQNLHKTAVNTSTHQIHKIKSV